MVFESTPFDLHALLNHTAEIVAPRAGTKAIALSVERHSDLPQYVCTDAGRLRQIALNLLSNAVKFTDQGSVTLRARAKPGADGRVGLRIEVADTGVGIPPERLSRLFKRFSQADETVSRQYGGTGLGLAISKKLAEGLGGSIGVDSTPGQGSTFWFEIPATVASAEQILQIAKGADSTHVDDAVAVLSCLPRALRVLVAEDNATNQLVVRSALAKFGIASDVAANGFEAIEAVKRAPYDVVLMDVHMPEMDGLQATRAIRALPGAQGRVPIIALTANAFDSDVARCREAGMNAHLGKPFRREDLIVALADAIKGTLAFTATAASNAPPAHDAPAIDWDVIERFRADSGDEMLQLLFDTYLTDTAVKLDRLFALAGSENAAAESVRLAHALKSASAMAGASALAQLAAHVEAALTLAPGAIDADDARRMKAHFEAYRTAVTAGKAAA
jgi:CheY-like chemotaxis protein/HPt (histidine-containing phosphotransfer) domain-containing protein